MKAPRFWAAAPRSAAARALQPLGAAYGALAAWRMARPGRRVAAPVVCIGNFTVGGAGKTPAAIALAKLLAARGENVAFLSRGYGGAARGAPVEVDPKRHSADEVGDEPLLLARVAPCFVARDRVAAAEAAIAAGAGVLVLDDGLQNPALAKDFSLAMIDGASGFGNGLCLPAGPLRAPASAQWPHVAIAIVVDAPDRAAIGWRDAGGGPATGARLAPDPTVAAQIKGRDLLAFAGIGRPEKFFATLTALGARLGATRGFPDHHRYGESELDALFDEAARQGLLIVTTEKDFVRLPATYAEKSIALPVTLRFDDEPLIAGLLDEALARRSRRGTAASDAKN
ncbi:MAG TPA: tetraacyldisaccharide 4'-kinase [Roseiarcus sp.]|nr:tetraacyldisaccharide 4'-kinase [Roseiarcus sp.]